MEIKRIKKLKINSTWFDVIWDSNTSGGSFDYTKTRIVIGTKDNTNGYIFNIIMHELLEIASCELHVRFYRTDVSDDYYFVYDHRQHDLIANMVAGWVQEFIK